MIKAGKATRKFKNCLNVQYQHLSDIYLLEGHVDFYKVKCFSILLENNDTGEVQMIGESYFDNAKLEEPNNWKSHKVYEEILKQIKSYFTADECAQRNKLSKIKYQRLAH